MEKCPNCDGTGRVNAMSGAHIPYQTYCDDCKGSGTVTVEIAQAIRKRHADWLQRFNAKID